MATLESSPGKDTHWSRASMARRAGLSQVDYRADLAEVRPQAAPAGSFKLSTDPLFVDKVLDVVGLYHDPPENAVVLCVDEKTQIQALDRTAPVLPMMPGVPERRTHDYVRHGTTSLFAAFNIATGTVIAKLLPPAPAPSSSASSWTAHRQAVPAGPGRAPGLRQLSPPTRRPVIKDWLARHPRFHAPLHPDQLVVDQPGPR